jgi:hypothetical protein
MSAEEARIKEMIQSKPVVAPVPDATVVPAVVAAPAPVQEIKEEKAAGLDIFGIRVPWWVIIAVAIGLALYYNMIMVEKKQIRITIPDFSAPASIGTPTIIKEALTKTTA